MTRFTSLTAFTPGVYSLHKSSITIPEFALATFNKSENLSMLICVFSYLLASPMPTLINFPAFAALIPASESSTTTSSLGLIFSISLALRKTSGSGFE